MHFLTRVTLTTLAAFTVLGTTTGECPEWLRLDLEVVRKLYGQVIQQKVRSGELTEAQKTLDERMRGKAETAVALADGYLTLPQAAARFRKCMRNVRYFPDTIDCTYLSGTADEKLCRYVIDWTAMHLEHDAPEKARAASRRLSAELDKLLRKGGVLVGP